MRICQSDIESGNTAEVSMNLVRAQTMAERLSQRIEDMLSLARTDHMENEWSAVSIPDSLSEVWANIGGPDIGESVRLSTTFQHREPVSSIRVRLLVILENLLSNALKYRDTTKKRTEIAIETRNAGSDLILVVRDNGIGIPADCHDKVFKLFQRFSDSGNPGSGLGLALVQKNVRYLDGTISFTSTPDGTEFTIRLPQRPTPPIEEAP